MHRPPRVARRHVYKLLYLSVCARNSYSTAHFYQNRQLELYASKQATLLSLRQLVFYGRAMSEERLIKSANYVRTELPIRIAHRLRDLQGLPYIVVMQEGVNRVYDLYWTAFEKFRRYPEVRTIEENDEFCQFVRGMLNEHSAVIPSLSLGLSLASPYLPPDQLDSFMRRMLVSRMSRRVLAEHHIALSDAFNGRDHNVDGEGHVGIIYTGLNVEKSVKKCASILRPPSNVQMPEVIIEGHLGTTFAYIREHLEYIVFELLKNSIQATVDAHAGKLSYPPILVTIMAGVNDIGMRISDQGGGLTNPHIRTPSDLFSFSHVRNATRMEDARLGSLRSVSERPAGMVATVNELVQRWQEEQRTRDNPEVEAGVGSHPRLGIGLPMCNIFSRYFGGSLELVSMDGWGTDAYLRLPKLGTNLEGIEF
ncbi:alpha-ketoacid dehydrogenase kinase N-terminal domain-containing protein [Vararia minispora EC-137]|uniref:Alpha-ketoacid dehydrogenase kinase N-terminal domain-containing protein n=1 Tax=Vararia minispora EC-137 TaxID=1314806 RepID=A0ACB8QYW0_9AGAM|nr:alpha-ketoacid dehydrogenase kinase N-terminal domain-containing protein [Vararia minispora EC-137]